MRITSVGISIRRRRGRKSSRWGRTRWRFKIQNRGQNLPGTRSNETSRRDNETRKPIRALRLRLRLRRWWNGSGVRSAVSRGGGTAETNHFASRLRSGNGSHDDRNEAKHTRESTHVWNGIEFRIWFYFQGFINSTPLRFRFQISLPTNTTSVLLLFERLSSVYWVFFFIEKNFYCYLKNYSMKITMVVSNKLFLKCRYYSYCIEIVLIAI